MVASQITLASMERFVYLPQLFDSEIVHPLDPPNSGLSVAQSIIHAATGFAEISPQRSNLLQKSETRHLTSAVTLFFKIGVSAQPVFVGGHDFAPLFG